VDDGSGGGAGIEGSWCVDPFVDGCVADDNGAFCGDAAAGASGGCTCGTAADGAAEDDTGVAVDESAFIT
jgi:hypothetical protein